MVFLLFDQMHGEIVGFVQRKVGLSAGRATCEFERRHWRTEGNAVMEAQAEMRVHLRFILITLGVIGLVTVLVLELGRRPGFFANSRSLGAIIAVELVLACPWRF
jgi:hypothetical protein